MDASGSNGVDSIARSKRWVGYGAERKAVASVLMPNFD